MEQPWQYNFVTTWKIMAPLDSVWELIYDQEKWPQWWKGVRKVETIQEGDENDLGKKIRYTWKSVLPYKLTFDMEASRVEKPFTLEGIANGELEGLGRWELNSENGITTLQYEWKVNTNKKWMIRLAPLLKPLFKWNHNVVMRRGAIGMAKKLNARLLKY